MKQATRRVLALTRDYARGLAIPIILPGFAQKLQTREQQVKRLKRRLTKERREVKRLSREVRHLKRRVGRVPVGEVGLLRRLNPISLNFGFDRGQPIDRYYIENFLASQAEDIRGRVLEIRRNDYTRKYGGERVNVSDVLDVSKDNRQASIHADLTRADHIPSDAFDCIILTQTLHFIYDLHSAIHTLYRILKPGGVLLATFPGISKTSCRECTQHGEYYRWMFTQLSSRQLFEEAFPATNLEIEAHGNVLVAVSFLHGLAVGELQREELDYHDSDYEVLITLRAVKPELTL